MLIQGLLKAKVRKFQLNSANNVHQKDKHTTKKLFLGHVNAQLEMHKMEVHIRLLGTFVTLLI